MDELFIILFWSGPIGLSIFLALLGVFIWLIAKANQISKRTKAIEKELEKEKGIIISAKANQKDDQGLQTITNMTTQERFGAQRSINAFIPEQPIKAPNQVPGTIGSPLSLLYAVSEGATTPRPASSALLQGGHYRYI